jgi:hypothetical protein
MTTYEPTAEAVEAAARAMADDDPILTEMYRNRAMSALTAVGPIIAAEVRGQREAFLPSDTLDPAWIAGWHAAVDHVAAHIESGGEPTTSVTVYDEEEA